MKILAHRGYWKSEDRKNSYEAVREAFIRGFGIETDIRDYRGELVISHNIADERSFALEKLFEAYNELGCSEMLALNVKADGIQDGLGALLEKYRIENYFVFDMSIPEQVVYRNRNFRFFTRRSDIETVPVQYEDACGVWMDSFYTDWISADSVLDYLKDNRAVSLVSPELHGRPREEMWSILKENDLHHAEGLYLCTDMPDQAKEYFYG